MGAKSDFEKILDQLLGGKKTAETNFKSQTIEKEDSLFSQIRFAFGPFGTMKQKHAYKTTIKSAPPQQPTPIEIKVEVQIPIPKPKTKRKMTFDQDKALKVFVKLTQNKIDEYSTDEEIKSAYRLLAKKYHPDFNKEGAEVFKTLSLAYQKILD